jgi:hypothetical protein
MAVALAALLAGGGATLLVSVPDLAYAARWTGTPGVFAVSSCATVGAPRERHRQCGGTFRSDDGGTVDAQATISQSLTAGDVIPVQRTAGGGYVRVGAAAICGWLAVALFGAALAGVAVLTVLALTRRTRSLVPAGGKVLLAAAGVALVSALIGAIAGAVA